VHSIFAVGFSHSYILPDKLLPICSFFCVLQFCLSDPESDLLGAAVVSGGLINHLLAFIHVDEVPSLKQFLYGTFEDGCGHSTTTSVDGLCFCQTAKLVGDGVPQVFVRLLSSIESKFQCAWIAVNIGGEQMFTEVSGTNKCDAAIVVAMMVLNDIEAPDEVRLQASSIIATFSDTHHRHQFKALAGCLPMLARTLQNAIAEDENDEFLGNICNVFASHAERLWFLSKNQQNERIQNVVESGACHPLLGLAAHESVPVALAALKAVHNISSGNSNQIEVLLKSGLIPVLTQMIVHQACGAAAAALLDQVLRSGSKSQMQLMIDSDMCLKVFDSRSASMLPSIIRTITTKGTVKQITQLVNDRCIINQLCECYHLDPTKAGDIVFALHTILKIGKACKTDAASSSEVALFSTPADSRIVDVESDVGEMAALGTSQSEGKTTNGTAPANNQPLTIGHAAVVSAVQVSAAAIPEEQNPWIELVKNAGGLTMILEIANKSDCDVCGTGGPQFEQSWPKSVLPFSCGCSTDRIGGWCLRKCAAKARTIMSEFFPSVTFVESSLTEL
jgi:hypothetical protein